MLPNNITSQHSSVHFHRQVKTESEKSAQIESQSSSTMFEDGFNDATPKLHTAEEAYYSFMSVLNRHEHKSIMTDAELLAQGEERGVQIGTTTPTNRLKTPYQFSVVYSGLTDLITGEQVNSITMNYVDRTKDIDCPGRFFINGKSFFEEATALYASDQNYLDHENAWLPKDISRYAKDISRFFDDDADDTSKLEKQIENYIRAASDPSKTEADLAELRFTIAGVDFNPADFIKTVDFLNSTLKEAGKTGYDSNETVSTISKYAKDNLNKSQEELLLSSQNNWSTYSKWAAFYGHDANMFKYI